ncbi:unnamed protein product [Phaedon cochleariae]|uniref:Uncharacterized protein n=1 Tax=Phaedon cochleariae TaxID=80249 RepID=A0A9N9SPR6_PHACE|nr:unnamed protein product [Phaedon cochleariae]
METCRFVVILLSYCVCSGSCYPSRPLNERSTDLAWEAWLLIDDQNQNKQHTNSDGVLRRRITPKSVFIAPTFSPESLPACAEGYNSDVMGRCMKIIRIDPDKQYDFLIEKLKEKFSSSFDYEDEEEEEDEVVPTQGPLQLNIPLEINSEDMREEDSEEDTEVALIVSPTKANPYLVKNKLDKRYSVLDDEQTQEMYLKQLAEATTVPQEQSTTPEETPTTEVATTVEATTATETDVTAAPTGLEPASTSASFQDVQVSTDDSSKQADDPSVYLEVPKIGATASQGMFLEVPKVEASQGIFNRRNRDRHNGLFFLPPAWSEAQTSYDKPIVLRFSRKKLQGDAKTVQNNEYYRSIPTDDFAYLFKFKHKQLNPI